MDHPLLKNPLDRDIVSLLAMSKLPPLEKRLWLQVIPDMTVDEKNMLKRNLEQEVEYETKVEEDAVSKFLNTLEQGV